MTCSHHCTTSNSDSPGRRHNDDAIGATRLQLLFELKLPATLPYILGGLKIAGGLSLIGAVVAEIAAGWAQAHGLRHWKCNA